MGMVVQHNMNAINSYNKLNANVAGMKKSSEKLSSGYRINRAGDDAAGLAVSEKMRSQIKGLNQAIRNSQDGINMIQTYEGAAQETHSILQRMKELATQSANGTYDNATDRAAIQLEFDQLNDELNQIADTDFNGTMALNGGEMADGTKADGNGIVNYQTAVRQAQQVGTAGGFVKAVDSASYKGSNTETVTFTAEIDDNGKVTWAASEGALGTLTQSTGDNKATGGFTYDGAVITVNTDKIVAGDTITIDFQKKSDAVGTQPGTIGYNVDLGKTGGDSTKGAAGVTTATIALTAATKVTSQEIADAFNALNGLTVADTYAKAGTAPASTTVNGVAIPSAGNTAEIGKVGDGKLIIDNSKKISYVDKAGTAYELATVTVGAMANGATNAGTVTTTVNVGQATFIPANDKAVALVEPDGKVSQSNSFEKSTAILTYTDSITLQTGARTKDSVNFTFNYNQDGTADMGDLKANLNLSARADGLNTENLSLATQESANAAIDQIDKAINKTSMVRASFGSIQNRLEHKITNLTTTSENLTEAESSIRDTDMASEMMNYTKFNILQQAAQSMLAQANQQPQSILQLLG